MLLIYTTQHFAVSQAVFYATQLLVLLTSLIDLRPIGANGTKFKYISLIVKLMVMHHLKTTSHIPT